MRSYRVTRWGEPLTLLESPTPVPANGDVLVRVTAAGVCHSDLHIHDGFYDMGGGKVLRNEDRGVNVPLTMGHEIAGVVEALGPDATGVEIGQGVAVYPWIGCGSCDACQRGDEQDCPRIRTLGILTDGGYTTHVLVPHAKYCLDLGSIPPEIGATIACSGITTYHALKEIDPSVLAEEPILIIGAGGLGLMALSILRGMGGRGAIVSDISPEKREAALAQGALAVVNPADADVLDQIRSLSAYGRGLRAAIDLVGNPATVQLGMDSLIKGGKLVLVGLMGGEITIPTPYLPSRAMTLEGSYVGTLQDMKDLMALMQEQHIPGPPVSTRPLDDAQGAIDDLRAGKVTGRAVLVT